MPSRDPDRDSLAPDPLEQFGRWFDEARAAGVPEPEAMVLSTCNTVESMPSSRVVLLRDYGPGGFVFYTNYGSRKASEIGSNPRASLLFHWREAGCQVRVSGLVERTSREQSETYFRSRPRLSRLGAWASRQSEPLPDRAALEKKMCELESRFPGEDIPLPPWWGGYRVLPSVFEFWRQGEHRLHDRFRYRKSDDGLWWIERLSP